MSTIIKNAESMFEKLESKMERWAEKNILRANAQYM